MLRSECLAHRPSGRCGGGWIPVAMQLYREASADPLTGSITWYVRRRRPVVWGELGRRDFNSTLTRPVWLCGLRGPCSVAPIRDDWSRTEDSPLSRRLTSASSRPGPAAGPRASRATSSSSQRAGHAPRVPVEASMILPMSHHSSCQAFPSPSLSIELPSRSSPSHTGPASREGSRTLRHACSEGPMMPFSSFIDGPKELMIVPEGILTACATAGGPLGPRFSHSSWCYW